MTPEKPGYYPDDIIWKFVDLLDYFKNLIKLDYSAKSYRIADLKLIF